MRSKPRKKKLSEDNEKKFNRRIKEQPFMIKITVLKLMKQYQKYVIGVTEFSLFETKLYLSLIIDLFNGEIVSYNISLKDLCFIKL